VSGYTFDKTGADIDVFFNAIRKAGDDYATLMAGGKLDDGATLLENTREDTITPFLGTASGTGDINMTSSQMATSIGKSDIFVIANGNLNLGKTALPTSSTTNTRTGITTGGGGAINVFSIHDVNVNESRIMTFYGGDITLWSDQGNINAGRGSRTAVSASPPRRQTINGVTTTVFTPPAIGSGIRAVTYGDNPPPPGDIHLFAPKGVIDAGEAGISGGQIILAALQVVNASNISFSSGSVGVPQPTEGVTGIGSLSGTGTLAQSSQLMAEASGIAATTATQASQMLDSIMNRWLDVRIIDYVTDESNDEKKEE
jgi:filamentous hemagglutinin